MVPSFPPRLSREPFYSTEESSQPQISFPSLPASTGRRTPAATATSLFAATPRFPTPAKCCAWIRDVVLYCGSPICTAVQTCDFYTWGAGAGRRWHSQHRKWKSRRVTLHPGACCEVTFFFFFSLKKLKEETFAVCLSEISGNNTHQAPSHHCLQSRCLAFCLEICS